MSDWRTLAEYTWKIGAGGFIGAVSLLEAPEEVVTRLARPINPHTVGFVSDLFVHPHRRGQGWAHTLLTSLTRHADKHKIDLWTYVSPFGDLHPGLKQTDLIKLYGGYNFVAVQDPEFEHEMVRRCARRK